MEQFGSPTNVVAFTVWLLSLLLNANESFEAPMFSDSEEDAEEPLSAIALSVQAPVTDSLLLMKNTLHNYRLCTSFNVFDDDVNFWVKPRSTTWFSRFLLEQYDNNRWISMFRMTKSAVFSLAELLRPTVQKKNTKYRLAIPVLVRVACTLFKLTHGANFTICSEMFAIGRSIVSKVLREVVHAINETMRHEISWPTGDKMRESQSKFSDLCGLPAVVGAIDGTHISISKPEVGAADSFYFKSGGYTLNCQAVVDSDKRFLDLYLGMPGSTNDSRMLQRSSLHTLAMQGNLMDANCFVDGFTPYLLGDSGYPLLPWLMVPHTRRPDLSISQTLFNRRLSRGRCVVENAFGILKQSFRELLVKSDLAVTFLPDVILCCAILHNVLLRQSHEEVEDLLEVLHLEGLEGEVVDEEPPPVHGAGVIAEDMATALGTEKRTELGVHLTTRHRVMP